MKSQQFETENLIFKFSENHGKYAAFRKVGDELSFLKSSLFMSALIAGMKYSMNGKYREEIEIELKLK